MKPARRWRNTAKGGSGDIVPALRVCERETIREGSSPCYRSRFERQYRQNENLRSG